MLKELKIKYFYLGDVFEAIVRLYRVANGETLLEYVDEQESIKFTDAHVYSSFRNLREYLKIRDKVLLCKGCSLNIHPSGAQLKSIYAFVLTIGVHINRDKDSIMIFEEELDRNKIVDYEDQRKFYLEWLESIKGIPFR